jgi:hypothetical protein
MNPYSHLVIANNIARVIGPENPQQYYWGATAPDIRYLARVPRQKTHITDVEIAKLITRFPHLKSFLQGYLVHCLVDEIDLDAIFFSSLPLSVLKGKLSQEQISIILELYYFENCAFAQDIAGNYNEVLRNLGLNETDCSRFYEFIDRYINSIPDKNQFDNLVQLMGLRNNQRIKGYLSAVERFQRNKVLKSLLFLGIRMGRVRNRIDEGVLASLNIA